MTLMSIYLEPEVKARLLAAGWQFGTPPDASVYQRLFCFEVEREITRYCKWDGTHWYTFGATPSLAQEQQEVVFNHALPWRRFN